MFLYFDIFEPKYYCFKHKVEARKEKEIIRATNGLVMLTETVKNLEKECNF